MKMATLFKIILGFIALVLSLIGLFIPILPTTPFIILSLWLFSSTPKIKNAVLKIPTVREYYSCYKEKKPIRKRTIVFSLVFLWITLIFSAIFVRNIIIIALLLTVGTLVTTHILWIARKKRTRESQKDKKENDIKKT